MRQITHIVYTTAASYLMLFSFTLFLHESIFRTFTQKKHYGKFIKLDSLDNIQLTKWKVAFNIKLRKTLQIIRFYSKTKDGFLNG